MPPSLPRPLIFRTPGLIFSHSSLFLFFLLYFMSSACRRQVLFFVPHSPDPGFFLHHPRFYSHCFFCCCRCRSHWYQLTWTVVVIFFSFSSHLYRFSSRHRCLRCAVFFLSLFLCFFCFFSFAFLFFVCNTLILLLILLSLFFPFFCCCFWLS